MQDKYVSLDPANADAQDYQQRKDIYALRMHEALGGDGSVIVSTQLAATGGLFVYA